MSSLSIPLHTICDVLLNFCGRDVILKTSSSSVEMNPPLPTLIIFGEPVDASMMSEFLPRLFLVSPIPAEASSIVVMFLLLQYLQMDLTSCSAEYPAKLVNINADESAMSKSSR